MAFDSLGVVPSGLRAVSVGAFGVAGSVWKTIGLSSLVYPQYVKLSNAMEWSRDNEPRES